MGSAVLDALALLLQRQPARSVVQLGGVRQVDQHLRNEETWTYGVALIGSEIDTSLYMGGTKIQP